jgi:putative membrane protein
VNEPAPEARRLHPATLVTRSLRVAPQMLAGGAGYAAVVAQEGLGGILLIAAAAALVGVVGAVLVWWRFRYTVFDDEIVIESGVLHRQRRVIPYDRVQDIAIERRLLARLFGTARVRVETGGSAADEGNLDMIALADAHALRDHIRRRRSEGTAKPAALPTADEPVLFEMDLARVLYSGLFNFSLIFLAAIFALLQYLDDFGLVDVGEWFTPERTEQAAGLVGLRLTLVLVALVLALGILAGVVRTVARDFGFRLTRAEAGLRRRRGLLTLTEVVIPIRRIQAAVIESGPVARRLGWYRLSFQTLGADRKEGGVQVAAAFARLDELVPILAEAGFPMPPPRSEFAHVPRRALVRWAGQYLLVGAVSAAAAWLIEPSIGLAALVMLALAVLGALRWRRHAYALDDQALFVADGVFNRRVWTLPFGRTQTLLVSRGPLQRRLRLATLLMDTAGASLFRSPEVVDLDGSDADALADRLLSLYYRARSETGRAR